MTTLKFSKTDQEDCPFKLLHLNIYYRAHLFPLSSLGQLIAALQLHQKHFYTLWQSQAVLFLEFDFSV